MSKLFLTFDNELLPSVLYQKVAFKAKMCAINNFLQRKKNDIIELSSDNATYCYCHNLNPSKANIVSFMLYCHVSDYSYLEISSGNYSEKIFLPAIPNGQFIYVNIPKYHLENINFKLYPKYKKERVVITQLNITSLKSLLANIKQFNKRYFIETIYLIGQSNLIKILSEKLENVYCIFNDALNIYAYNNDKRYNFYASKLMQKTNKSKQERICYIHDKNIPIANLKKDLIDLTSYNIAVDMFYNDYSDIETNLALYELSKESKLINFFPKLDERNMYLLYRKYRYGLLYSHNNYISKFTYIYLINNMIILAPANKYLLEKLHKDYHALYCYNKIQEIPSLFSLLTNASYPVVDVPVTLLETEEVLPFCNIFYRKYCFRLKRKREQFNIFTEIIPFILPDSQYSIEIFGKVIYGENVDLIYNFYGGPELDFGHKKTTVESQFIIKDSIATGKFNKPIYLRIWPEQNEKAKVLIEGVTIGTKY